MLSRLIASLGLLLCSFTIVQAARPLTGVVSQEAAQRYGLTRAWATQIEIDRSRGRVAHVSLQAGLLMVQTNQAALHVLDAETRQTLWVAHVGRPGAVTSPPAANEKFVVSTNGGMLYLFDRPSGKLLWDRKLTSVPSAGPAISDSRVYVPLVTGMVSGYRLPAARKDETPGQQKLRDNALNYAGKGMAFHAPVVTKGGNVVWGTDAGNILAVSTNEMIANYRFKARDAVLAGLMYRPPYIFAASRDGYVYALRAEKGFARWQFSIGYPIAETPMATDEALYVVPETGGMYKLARESGERLWLAPGVFQFLAASPTRLYTADARGQLMILDANSGARLGTLPTQSLSMKVFNRDNDRIYLVSSAGLVQCLHEEALREPVWHALTAPSDGEEPQEKDTAAPKETKPAADDGADPFGVDDAPADDAAMEDQ